VVALAKIWRTPLPRSPPPVSPSATMSLMNASGFFVALRTASAPDSTAVPAKGHVVFFTAMS